MFTTDINEINKRSAEKRIWQGIPSIEVTKNGRIFTTYYSGGVKEEIGNYVLLDKSDDGVNYLTVALALPESDARYFDPCVWLDPLGRLWVTWSRFPGNTVFGVICDEPDADKLVFGDEFVIGHDVMMNKPTVLSSGEWAFPVAVWREGVHVIKPTEMPLPAGSYAYITSDNGKTFECRGKADVPDRSYDEHMFLEQEDGSVTVFVRTSKGIGTARSLDGGRTWSEGEPNVIAGPCSRFHIRRLPSGRILLVNHYEFTGRNNLTAFLSEDDGRTWKYRLLLDERNDVSYPDAAIGKDGSIYIIYDRERGALKKTLDEALACAREVLVARISEQDIINGAVSGDGYLKRVVSKLTVYEGDDPFAEKAQ